MSDSSPTDCSISEWCHYVINITEGNNASQCVVLHGTDKMITCLSSSDCQVSNSKYGSVKWNVYNSFWAKSLFKSHLGKIHSVSVHATQCPGVEKKWAESESSLCEWNYDWKRTSVHFFGINVTFSGQTRLVHIWSHTTRVRVRVTPPPNPNRAQSKRYLEPPSFPFLAPWVIL